MTNAMTGQVQPQMDEAKMAAAVCALWDQVKGVIRTAEGEVNGVELAGFCGEIYVAGFTEGMQAGALWGEREVTVGEKVAGTEDLGCGESAVATPGPKNDPDPWGIWVVLVVVVPQDRTHRNRSSASIRGPVMGGNYSF